MKTQRLGAFLVAFCAAIGCGGGGSGNCPDVQAATEAGVTGADFVVICEGCDGGSEEFTCSSDSLTITCSNGILTDSDAVAGFASTSDCTKGTATCFNGAVNTSCLDTASE